MKNVFGLFLSLVGALLFQTGFDMLSPAAQDEFAKKLVDKVGTAFLTLRATDAEDSAPSKAVSNAETLFNSDGSAVPARRS